MAPRGRTRSTSTCDLGRWSPGERLTMIRTHGKGSLAAIGGMTAMAAVLAGLPAARADEFADLRANQQLLQQRIDQLAQAQAQMAPLGAPGTTGGVAYGTHAVPGAGLVGGSFPRSF